MDKAKGSTSLLNDAVILDEAIVEHTASMIVQVILRPRLFVLSGVSNRDLPLSSHGHY